MSMVDAHAEQVKAEIKVMAQRARDAIDIKVGWMLRSMGAKQGWITRRNNQKENLS